MKRLFLLLLLAPLTGCVGMEEFYAEDTAGLEWLVGAEGGCSSCQGTQQTSGTLPAGLGVIQTTSSQGLPPVQTREPDLLNPAR